MSPNVCVLRVEFSSDRTMFRKDFTIKMNRLIWGNMSPFPCQILYLLPITFRITFPVKGLDKLSPFIPRGFISSRLDLLSEIRQARGIRVAMPEIVVFVFQPRDLPGLARKVVLDEAGGDIVFCRCLNSFTK